MEPIDFPEKNIVLGKPQDMTEEECMPLPAYKGWDGDLPVFISKWQPTEEEITKISAGCPVWLMMYSRFHPPICLGINNPFSLRNVAKIIGEPSNG